MRKAPRRLPRSRHSRLSSGMCRRSGQRNRNSHADRGASDRRFGTRHRPSESVAQDLFFGVGTAGVAVEADARDRSDRFCPTASPISLSAVSMQKPSAPRTGYALFDIVPDQPDFQNASRVPGHATDRANFAVIVDHADIAFGRAVKFHDFAESESGFGTGPRFPDAVRCRSRSEVNARARRMRRRVQQIAAQFADILEHCRAVAAAVVPEFAGGEFAADHDRAAGKKWRSERQRCRRPNDRAAARCTSGPPA